jgi:hypothetical protein
MAKQIAPVGVVFFVLFAALAAVCQNVRQSLPDAPSVQAATHTQNSDLFVADAPSPLRFGATSGLAAAVMRQSEFDSPDKAIFSRRASNTIFGKYLYPPTLKPRSGYHPLSSPSLVGRATYAASRTLITRDDSGKARLNTSYLLRTLTSVAKDTASTPYWRRSRADPFSDFGSTVGNDAGMNLWREFGPGLQQLMKSHTPQFVSRIEMRITHK